MSQATQPDGDMLFTLMCIKTAYTDVVFYYVKIIQIQA